MALNDTLWEVLEKVHLGEFFEEKNIPPVVFPIAILLILAIIAFFLLQPAEVTPESDPCGDGICDDLIGEDVLSCPSDCQEERPPSSKVIVKLEGEIKSSIQVRLEDDSGDQIQTKTGDNNEFIFSTVSADRVRAVVSNYLNGETISSVLKNVQGDETELTVILSNDFFGEDPPEQENKAVLNVIVKDSETNSPVTAKVNIVIPSGAGSTYVESKDVSGSGYFTLTTGQYYALIVEATGYHIYESRDQPFVLEPGVEREILVKLDPTTESVLREPSLLTVCVMDQDQATITGGIEVHTLTGTKLLGESLVEGCVEAELVKGDIVTVSTTGLPDDCTDTNSEISLESADEELNLVVTCDSAGPGNIRVKIVNGTNTVLTQDATITAWYPDGTQIWGTGSSYSLTLGVDGYTEFLEVDSTKDIYFVVANLDGYDILTSNEQSVSGGQNKSVTLTVSLTPPPELDMSINGISYANPVPLFSQLSVSLSNVIYGQTDVTNSSTITMELAAVNCTVSGSVGICQVPEITGTHDLLIKAQYNSHYHEEVKQVSVVSFGGSYFFDITAHAIVDQEPPIDLTFDIKFNDTPLNELQEGKATIYYEDGGVTVFEDLGLSGSDGTYSVTVNSPFPGAHKATLSLKEIRYDVLYEETFTHYFNSWPSSVQFTSELTINPHIAEPDESGVVYLRLKQNNNEVADLQNLYMTLDDQTDNLVWDSNLHVYSVDFTAPSVESIYSMVFELQSQELESDYLYVVDTSKNQASECSISECENMPDIRKCVDKHRNENFYSEDDVIGCIEDGWGILPGVSTIHCLPSVGNRGDWNNNCELDSSGTYGDDSLMAEFLRTFTDQTERNEYSTCGDMDNDGDVDDEDLTCLNNIISTSWFGDSTANVKSDGTCDNEMSGGFCFTIKDDLPGDFDGSENFDSEDSAIMQMIISSVNNGVEPPEELLAIADFEQNGLINDNDLDCLNYIISTTGSIDGDCLAVYDFACSSIKGDLNQDESLGDFDILFETWMVEGRLADPGCADLNDDNILNEEDLLCLEAMATGNSAEAYEYCTTCQYKMTELGIYGDEICNDGYDNDCDGVVDATPGRYNECECNIATGCGRQWDNNGIAGVDDGDYSLCRAMSWENDGEFQWLDVEDVETLESDDSCVLELNCQYWQCADVHHVCSKGSGDPGWFLIPSTTVHSEQMGLDAWRNRFDDVANGEFELDDSADAEPEVSMDGENNVSGECGSYEFDCETYTTYYGPYGSHLPCEGASPEGISTDTLCGDTWDNNCLGGELECVGDPDCSSGW